MRFVRGSGQGAFRATGMAHTGKRGRPAKLYIGADGQYYVLKRGRQQWVSKWKVGLRPKLKYDGSNWHQGRNGQKWTLRKVANVGRCPYCRLVRWVTFSVRLMVHGGKGKGWTRSRHVKKADVRRPLDRIPVMGRVPVKKCKCLPHWPGSRPSPRPVFVRNRRI